jgi:hypothetical protein
VFPAAWAELEPDAKKAGCKLGANELSLRPASLGIGRTLAVIRFFRRPMWLGHENPLQSTQVILLKRLISEEHAPSLPPAWDCQEF